MKVTKAKGLNAKPNVLHATAPRPAGHLETPLHLCPTPRSAARASQSLARAEPLVFGSAPLRRGPPVALDHGPMRSEAPSSELRARSAAESLSGPMGAVPARAERKDRFCIQGLCFGDFHLALPMKVSRPPGRDPAG